MKRIFRELFPWMALTCAVVLIAIVAQPLAAASAKAERCGANDKNAVAAQFAIPAASRIFDYFPNMGTSPELSEDNKPAYVVVFNDPYVSRVRVTPGRAPIVVSQQNVICVIQADGTINVYADVSRVGYSAP